MSHVFTRQTFLDFSNIWKFQVDKDSQNFHAYHREVGAMKIFEMLQSYTPPQQRPSAYVKSNEKVPF